MPILYVLQVKGDRMNYKEKYRQWLTFADPDTKAELESLTDEKKINRKR